MKLALFSLLGLASFTLSAMELPNQVVCQSNDYPVFKNGKGSTLILDKFGMSAHYHYLTLKTMTNDFVGGAESGYRGVDVTYGGELKKYAFTWVSGAYGGLEDPFKDTHMLEIDWGSYGYDKSVRLAILRYLPGKNAQEMKVKFYSYKCQ